MQPNGLNCKSDMFNIKPQSFNPSFINILLMLSFRFQPIRLLCFLLRFLIGLLFNCGFSLAFTLTIIALFFIVASTRTIFPGFCVCERFPPFVRLSAILLVPPACAFTTHTLRCYFSLFLFLIHVNHFQIKDHWSETSKF